MRGRLVLLLSWMIFLFPVVGRTHGENAPGPNGGEIRMPGAFHTEIKHRGREFQIFLLDLKFQNPTNVNSTVAIEAVRAGPVVVEGALPAQQTWVLGCRATRAMRPPGFICSHPKFRAVDGDVLKVTAKRGEDAGAVVEYKLPLLAAPKPHVKSNTKSNPKLDAKTADKSHDPGHGEAH